MGDKLTIGNPKGPVLWLINNVSDTQDTRTQVRQVCIVQALVNGGINNMLLDCKEFVLFQQKSGRFVFLSRRTKYLIVSRQNIVSRPQIDFSLTSFQNHFAKNLTYLISTMTG